MKRFIEKIEENIKENPNMAVLFDDMNPKGITYSQIDEMSGKVYSYLKSHNIGKEDFVLISLPRGVYPIIAMIGIWKAGAALAIVEENYAPERIEYIRKDCNCKLVIDKECVKDILKCESLKGYEKTDSHDAAYAIYTSGTTGNPKGVLHEYGNLERCIMSINLNGKPFITKKDRGALLAPLNFVASMMVILYVLYEGGCKLHVVSYTTIKNPMLLKKFFLEKMISITFLTPSYVRMLKGQTGPFLKKLIVGSEPANDVYMKKVQICNLYAMSESGFVVGLFEIDKPYETCPIGKPQFDLELKLVDESGNEVENGEIGELCFENPFVRGYINLPKETENAFKDGIYHTGDLAKKLPDGNYVLLGRSNDMIKINGNRIEPAEIEAAVKQVLNINWAAAKGFDNGEKSYICIYYTDDITIDVDDIREKLLKRLPYYMIPSYYVRIDNVPLKANGKLDRKALQEPNCQEFRSKYVAPTNETEKKICKAFEKVLKLENIGINDDFYEMGGDSLGAIQVIVESGLPGFNSSEIFRGRTAKNIAKLYEESHVNSDEGSPEEKNSKSMQLSHPLTSEQTYMIDYQLYTPKSTMYNLFTMLKFSKDDFDFEKLVKAIYIAIKNHPALLTTFSFNEDGEIVQKYTPEVLKEIKIEKITEEKFKEIKDELVQPFKIINSCLHRCRFFETEKNGYLFFDVHHTVFDGTSFKVLMSNVAKAYMGMPLEKDYYYLMLQEREDAAQTEFYEESKKYFEEMYSNKEWSTYPKTDNESRENEMGELLSTLGIKQEEMQKIEKQYKISRNEFFITVSALAISIYNNKPNVKISWIYNGRDDVNMMTTVGLLFRDLPIGLCITDEQTIRNLYSNVNEQVRKGIEHSCYPYVEINSQVISDDVAYLLYQRDIRDVGGLDGMDVESVDIRQNQSASQTVLDIQILDGQDGLQIMMDYAASRYDNKSMESFKDLFAKIAKILIMYDDKKDVTVKDLKHDIKNKGNMFKKIISIFSKKQK